MSEFLVTTEMQANHLQQAQLDTDLPSGEHEADHTIRIRDQNFDRTCKSINGILTYSSFSSSFRNLSHVSSHASRV